MSESLLSKIVKFEELSLSLPTFHKQSYEEAVLERQALGWCKYPMCRKNRRIISENALFYIEASSLQTDFRLDVKLIGYCSRDCLGKNMKIIELLPEADLLEEVKKKKSQDKMAELMKEYDVQQVYIPQSNAKQDLRLAEPVLDESSNIPSHLGDKNRESAILEAFQDIQIKETNIKTVEPIPFLRPLADSSYAIEGYKPKEAKTHTHNTKGKSKSVSFQMNSKKDKLAPKSKPMVREEIVERDEEGSIKKSESEDTLNTNISVTAASFYPAPISQTTPIPMEEVEEVEEVEEDEDEDEDEEEEGHPLPKVKLPPLSSFGKIWTFLSSLITHETRQYCVYGIEYTGSYSYEQVELFSKCIEKQYEHEL
jgi:hypothetical protein